MHEQPFSDRLIGQAESVLRFVEVVFVRVRPMSDRLHRARLGLALALRDDEDVAMTFGELPGFVTAQIDEIELFGTREGLGPE